MRSRVVLLLTITLVVGASAERAGGQSSILRPDGSPAPRYGDDVALLGERLVVGAPGDDTVADDAGAVYLYESRGGAWALEQRILPRPSWGAGTALGEAVALSADTLMVSDKRRLSARPTTGAVHVYRLDGPNARYRATLQPDGQPINAGFGSSIALLGSTAVIGAPGAAGRVDLSGAAYVYERVDDVWRMQAELLAPDGASFDGFGAAVALADSFVFVGAPAHGNSGAMYVFERSGERWSPAQKLEPPAGVSTAGFGASVAVHDGRLVVGATPHTLLAGQDTRPGAALAFVHDAGEWRPVATMRSPRPRTGDGYGSSVAVAGRTVIVGAPGADSMGRDSGVVHLYEWGSSGPEHRGRIARPTAGGRAGIGSTLALGGGKLATGAPDAAAGAGLVLTYRLADVLREDRLSFDLLVDTSLGLSDPRVNAVAFDPDGYILLGTLGGSLEVFDGHRLRRYRDRPDSGLPVGQAGILALLADRSSRIWVGTEDGLERFERRSGRLRRYRLGGGEHPTEPVVALLESRNGTIWTGSNGRLYHLDPEADRFRQYEHFATPADEAYVSGIQEGSEGSLWVLAKNLWDNHASLYRIDPARGTHERYRVGPEWGQVGPLLVDSRDRIWIKGPSPTRLTSDGRAEPVSPPFETSHWSWLEDSSGSIWVGTREGLYEFPDGGAGAVRRPIVPAGSRTAAWNFVRAIAEAADGSLVLGTQYGAFRLPRQRARSPVPLVFSRVAVAGRSGSREFRPEPGESLELSHEDYRLGFEFAALDYSGTRDYRYHYRLRGFDRDWVAAGDRPAATYTSVGPGRYVFEVRAAVDGDEESAIGAALPIVVRPPFWATTWFRALGGLLVGALLAGLVLYRARGRKELARMRSRIAGDLHDDLSTSLSGIALLSERLRSEAGLSPVQSEQLARVTETSREMLEDLRDLVWLVDPDRDRLQDLVLKMRGVAETLLPAGGWTFVADAPGAVELDMERRREVLRIYKEVLHNAHRHAEAGLVATTVTTREGRFRLEVSDDGVGFAPEHGGQGQGLRSIAARARRLRAELLIDSAPGRGTRVRLEMPLS